MRKEPSPVIFITSTRGKDHMPQVDQPLLEIRMDKNINSKSMVIIAFRMFISGMLLTSGLYDIETNHWILTVIFITIPILIIITNVRLIHAHWKMENKLAELAQLRGNYERYN